MRMLCAWVVLAVCLPAASGQRLVIESDTREGQLLQDIDAEKDEAKRLVLLESFAKQYPNHEAVTWVLSHIQAHYLGVKQFDRVLELGTRILGLDGTELSAAHNCLKAAEAKKDLRLLKVWSAQTGQLAKRNTQLKKPEYGDEDDVAEWKQKVEYARQVEQYTEYALYFASLQSKDPKVKTELIATLEQRNPMSEYLAQMRTTHTTVVRQVDVEQAVAAAEALFASGEFQEDMLFMVTTHLMQKRRDPEKVVNYSLRLIDLLSTKSKPDNISDSEWERKKRLMVGTSHWMAGVLYSTKERFALADKHLRAALPYLKNADMLAGAYYHLGFVNYQMAEAGERIRIHDAVRFTRECIGINSAVQYQASENLKAMKAEYALQD